MTLRELAYKNIKGNFNKYIMYYLSNTLVVLIFFIFANFIFNPVVSNISSLGTKGILAANTMKLCEGVILVFTFFFTIYSISNFLKSREKEFGLLAMFGLTKNQIRRYVMYENLIVSVISIITGTLLGILFSKLFFMAITVIMDLDVNISFAVAWEAVVLTFSCFLLLFQGIGFITSYKIKNNNIIELLKGSRIPKPVPKFSKVKTVIAVVLIAAGYALAVFSGMAIIITMFPILILTITGTYFLFSQFSIYITDKMKRNKSVFYKGINMITLSQIIYKLNDNAKVLFIISIIGAVTLTASASVYSAEKSFARGIEESLPQDISVVERGINSHEVIDINKLEETLLERGHEIAYKNKIVVIEAYNKNKSSETTQQAYPRSKDDFYIISNTDYNIIVGQLGRRAVSLQGNEIIIHTFNAMISRSNKLFEDNEVLDLNISSLNEKFVVKGEHGAGVINPIVYRTNTAVISDEAYNRIIEALQDEEKIVYYGYSLKDWYKASDTMKTIEGYINKEKMDFFTERITMFSDIMQTLRLFLFIGTFIAILFFIANGSIIYFKMFNEIIKDRQEFISLKKIGLADGEMKKIISVQAFTIFSLPFVVAFTHSAFALVALSNLLVDNLAMYFLTIAGVYLVFQLAYYVFAKTMYMKQIRSMNM